MDVPAAVHEIDVAGADGHHAVLALRRPHAARAGVLFVPAMGVPARKYAAFADALAARGIASALHELRGGGTSGVRARRGVDWGYRGLLEDITASRDALEREAPDIAWAIGGHSLGAQLAALALALAPHRWSGLLIAGSGLPWWRSFPWWQRPFLLGVFAWFRLLAALFGYFPGHFVGFAGDEARHVIREWSRSGLAGRYAVDGIDADLEAALARVEVPVLGLRFAHDRYVPRASFDALLAKLPRATTTRIELEPGDLPGGRADHFAWMRDPAPVADAVAAWATAWPAEHA